MQCSPVAKLNIFRFGVFGHGGSPPAPDQAPQDQIRQIEALAGAVFSSSAKRGRWAGAASAAPGRRGRLDGSAYLLRNGVGSAKTGINPPQCGLVGARAAEPSSTPGSSQAPSGRMMR